MITLVNNIEGSTDNTSIFTIVSQCEELKTFVCNMDYNAKELDEKHGNFETVYKPLTYKISEPHPLKNDGQYRKINSLFLYISSITGIL